MSDIREDFEEAAARLGFSLRMRDPGAEDGEYQQWQTQGAWDMWQEAHDLYTQPQSADVEEYPNCDTCGAGMNYMPWHYSTETERHLHSCDQCWPLIQIAAAPQPPCAVVPDERGTNEYGLDVGYFRSLFNRELSSIRNFRPDELARVLARAAKTADASVLQESEFQPQSAE